jgi:hypothetical protein
MCKRSGVSIDHVLLHCHYAHKLWSLVFCLFGIHYVLVGCSGYIRLCLKGSWICWSVGEGPLVDILVLIFGV